MEAAAWWFCDSLAFRLGTWPLSSPSDVRTAIAGQSESHPRGVPEGASLDGALRVLLYQYLTRVECLDREFLPVRTGTGAVMESLLFDWAGPMSISPGLVASLEAFLSAWPSPDVRLLLTECSTIWDAALLEVLKCVLRLPAQRFDMRPECRIRAFFVDETTGPEERQDPKEVVSDVIDRGHAHLFVLLKRSFALNWQGTAPGSCSATRLNWLGGFLQALWRRMAADHLYELMPFFISFYTLVDPSVARRDARTGETFAGARSLDQQVVALHEPLGELLRVRVAPIRDEHRAAKQYLLSRLNPLRSILEQRLEQVRSRTILQ